MMGGRGFGDYDVGIGEVSGGSGDHSRGCVGDRRVRGAVGSGREVVPQSTAIINVVSVTRPGRVHGTEVHDVILDTGCTHTLVQQHLVPVNRKGSDTHTETWCRILWPMWNCRWTGFHSKFSPRICQSQAQMFQNWADYSEQTPHRGDR